MGDCRFLGGLLGHSLKEVGARALYARQNAILPLLTAGINVALYAVLGSILYRPLGAPGIALTDSVVFTLEALLLLILLSRKYKLPLHPGSTIGGRNRNLAGRSGHMGQPGISGTRTHALLAGCLSMLAGLIVSLPWMRKEIQLLFHL